MCKASIHAENQRPANKNETLGLGVMSDYGLGAFHPVGQSVEECVVCLENGAELTLANIPDDARDVYGLGQHEDVIFIETEGSHVRVIHDRFLFPAHPDIGAVPVAHFAGKHVRALVHSIEGSDDVVEDIKRLALQPLPVDSTPSIAEIAARSRRLDSHVA